MNEFQLKYGTNPNQKPARIFMADGSDLPVTILNGKPGYINFLDAFNSYQLVRDLKKALGQPAAASFKHVSPAGAAIGLPLDETLRKMYHISAEAELSPLACAYARARGADRMSSFGDWIALSDVCDLATAKLIQHEVSDGIIAPGYDADALEVLKSKKKGNYNIVAIDPDYIPAPLERRTVFGVTFEQGRQELPIDDAVFGYHDRWLAVALGYPCRRYAHNARVPAFTADYYDPAVGKTFFFYNLCCFFENFIFGFAALCVKLIYPFRKLERFGFIICSEEPECNIGITEPSRRVYSRRYSEGYSGGVHIAAFDSRNAHNCRKPRRRRAFKLFYSILNNAAVFALQRHNVSGDGNT